LKGVMPAQTPSGWRIITVSMSWLTCAGVTPGWRAL
jgi:hypothetical protein